MSGIDNLNTRLNYRGGGALGRLRDDKLYSFTKALENSYQSAEIQLYDGTPYQCLINPDKLKPDYDNKIISISPDAGMQAGDTFYWPENQTHWLVYLPELTETAYFRAYIRRCRYSVTINDSVYYLYIQGPTETDIKWRQKAGVTWNELNHSLSMYVASTADSSGFFQRFQVVEIAGKNWRVEAVDSISIEGLLEVELEEYYTNSLEDLEIVPVESIPDPYSTSILGDSIVHPYDIGKTYTITQIWGGTWSIGDTNLAVIKVFSSTSVTLDILSGRSGTFDLSYYDRFGFLAVTLPITIVSL